MAKISQREAQRMRKELRELHERAAERQRSWSSDWPGGVNIDTITVNDVEWYIVQTAQKLGCAVVARAAQNGKHELLLYAMPTSDREGEHG